MISLCFFCFFHIEWGKKRENSCKSHIQREFFAFSCLFFMCKRRKNHSNIQRAFMCVLGGGHHSSKDSQQQNTVYVFREKFVCANFLHWVEEGKKRDANYIFSCICQYFTQILAITCRYRELFGQETSFFCFFLDFSRKFHHNFISFFVRIKIFVRFCVISMMYL